MRGDNEAYIISSNIALRPIDPTGTGHRDFMPTDGRVEF